MLALFELLARVDRDHPALLGGCAELVKQGVVVRTADDASSEGVPESLARELRELDGSSFDLLAFLVCSHHGKVRASLHASPADQDFELADRLGMPIRGVCEGDRVRRCALITATGDAVDAPEITVHLDLAQLGISGRYGASWRERTLALQQKYGPFALAWLEALVRTADIRASRDNSADPLLEARP